MHMKKGFTLIELLIVIALIAILAAAIIIGLNPARQFSQARNSQRWSHVNAVMNAVNQNVADNNGTWTCAAGALPATATNMSSTAGDYDICGCVVTTYMSSLPFDPNASGASYTSCADYNSGYTVSQDTDGRITIAAPSAEVAATISVTN
jgi:prepilin-type N-terminal cleavage/methylation domain-containing protein